VVGINSDWSYTEECRAAGRAAAGGRSALQVPPVMLDLHTFMDAHGVDARREFEACDLDGSGVLEYPELRQMIKSLVPRVTPGAIRHLLAGRAATATGPSPPLLFHLALDCSHHPTVPLS